MRRAVLLVAAVAMGLLIVFGGVALAKTFTCKANEACVGTNKADKITGTNKADTIKAKGGNDTINARGGKDKVNAGPGRDVVRGGDGNDTINIADDDDDLVDCGPGNDDTVFFNIGDGPIPGTEPDGNCENIIERGGGGDVMGTTSEEETTPEGETTQAAGFAQ
jgi:Ca2+-binding RTX toxin-like protein